MTTYYSLNYKLNTWKFQAQTWGEHVVYRNCFWHSEQFLYTTCSTHVLQKEELLTKIYLYRWRDVNCLKLEGYKVVLIDYYDWNKMSMRDNASKINYIRTLFEEQGIKVNNKNKDSNSNLAKTKSAQKLYQGSPLPENHSVLTWIYSSYLLTYSESWYELSIYFNDKNVTVI